MFASRKLVFLIRGIFERFSSCVGSGKFKFFFKEEDL